MSIKRIDVGARMSGAVIHGNTVYLAGQVGEGESVTDQCKSALAEVDRLLAAAGSNKSKILQTLIYLSDMSYFRRNECCLGSLGRSEEHAGSRHQRSETRCAEVQGRVHRYGCDRLRLASLPVSKPVGPLTGFLFGRSPRACASA